jgi:hypothetical protein
VYRGKTLKQLDYNADGSVKTENHITKVEYGSLMWGLYLKNLKTEYGAATVERVVEEKVSESGEKSYEEVKDFAHISKEVELCFEGEAKPMTPEQKKIAELEAKLELLLSGGTKNTKEVVKEAAAPSEDIDALRKEYEELYGEKPHHLFKAEKLITLINEKKSK